jgi:hypothetical protein
MILLRQYREENIRARQSTHTRRTAVAITANRYLTLFLLLAAASISYAIGFTMDDPVALTEPFTLTLSYTRVKDTDHMTNEAECDQESDRNPMVNGRFRSITTRDTAC